MKSLKKLVLVSLFTIEFSISASPIFNIFELGVVKGQEKLYNEIGENNIQKSVGTEAGTLGMYSVNQKDNPNTTYMFEVYKDEDSYKTHIQSPQYKTFVDNAPQILGDRKKIDIDVQFLGDKKITQTDKIITNFVIVEVKPDDNEEFKRIVIDEMEQSLKVEKGVLVMYAATDKQNPNKWYFFEIYRNEKEYQKHRNTKHFKQHLLQTENMLKDKEFIKIVPIKLMNKGNLNFKNSN